MSFLPTQELKQESQRLLADYQANEDSSIRNKIIELNLGLVQKEARHWANQCQESYDDLVQVGSLGLCRAIERFDPEKGYALSSFAIPYIKGEIQHYLRDRGHSIRIPRRCLDLKTKANKIVRKLRNELNRQPTDREIANHLGVSLAEWEDVKLAHQNRQPISLDLKTGDSDEKNTLGDLLPDNQYRSFQLAQEDCLRLHNALCQLEERTRQVLEFVFLQDLTQKQTAEKLGISVVTVSRRIKQGLLKMRGMIKKDELS